MTAIPDLLDRQQRLLVASTTVTLYVRGRVRYGLMTYGVIPPIKTAIVIERARYPRRLSRDDREAFGAFVQQLRDRRASGYLLGCWYSRLTPDGWTEYVHASTIEHTTQRVFTAARAVGYP